MKYYTKAQIVLERPKDLVFEAILKTCKDIHVKIKESDCESYKIEGKTPLTLMRVGFKVWVFLTDIEGGTLLEVYDDFPVLGINSPDKNFMEKFFKAFGKYIPLKERFGIEVVEELGISGQNPSLICTDCKINVYSYSLDSGALKLCRRCFENRFGNIVLSSEGAQYYGGHKAYIAGGVFSDTQAGRLVLTSDYLLFQNNDKSLTKRWEIVIPLEDIIIDRWRVEEVSRRKQISGIGSSLGESISMGTGVMHDTGKAHHLVVPYVDKNGIPHEPRFGVPSMGGKAIREWSGKIYESIVNKKKNTPHEQKEPENPLNILKIRLAKGEISKEEYDELIKVVGSRQ